MRVLLPAFATLLRCRVQAICARDTHRLVEAARAHDVPQVLADWRVLTENSEVDAVALALPPAIQEVVALELLKAGKHVFCEKPLAATLEGALRMLDAADEEGRVLAVNFSYRFVESFERFAQLLHKRPLGAVRMVTVDWLLSWRANADLSFNWKSDLSLGGGTCYTMGCHVLDYLRWYLGDIAAVQVRSGAMVASRPASDGSVERVQVSGDDTCEFSGHFNSGVPFSARIYTALPVSTGHSLKVYCEQGILELSNGGADDSYSGFDVRMLRAGESDATSAKASLQHFQDSRNYTDGRIGVVRRAAEAFSASVLDGEPFPMANEDALAVQRVLEQFRRRREDMLGTNSGFWC